MRHLKLDYVDLLSLHGINDRELLRWSLRKRRVPGGGAAIAKGGPGPVYRLFHARHHRHHSGNGAERGI